MSKTLAILAGVATVGTTGYYAAPTIMGLDTGIYQPVSQDPDYVMARLGNASAMDFFDMMGAGSKDADVLQETLSKVGDNSIRSDVRLFGEHILRTELVVKPNTVSGSEIYAKATLPESRLTNSPIFRNGDVEKMERLASVFAKEYALSVIDLRPLAKDREARIIAETGMNENQVKALVDRFQEAIQTAYGDDIRGFESERRGSDGFGAEERNSRPAYDAERAAERAIRDSEDEAEQSANHGFADDTEW